MNCPYCGSKKTRKFGLKVLVGRKVQKHQCNDCGHTFTADTPKRPAQQTKLTSSARSADG